MGKKYPIGGWVYFSMSDENYTIKELDRWAESGCTVMLAGIVGGSEAETKKTLEFLDRAEELGIGLILDCGCGYYYCDEDKAEQIEEQARKNYERFKGHPALRGFHVGDEPGTQKLMENAIRAIGIQMKIAPELNPYLNMSGDTPWWDFCGTEGLKAYLKKLKEETGCREVCFDNYGQADGDGGVTGYFRTIKAFVDAAEEAGLEPWETPICSAHGTYRPFTEYQYMWQITTSAALGIRGITWFRFYDRIIAPNYHSSPIDEYGNTTLTFERLGRCQKRFNDQFGELITSLKRKKSWLLGFQRMCYPMFGENSHELIKEIVSFERMVISTFEDENGTEYLCLVNAEMEQATSVQVRYDMEKCRLTGLILNGKIESRYRSGRSISLYPGQMAIYRIDKI